MGFKHERATELRKTLDDLLLKEGFGKVRDLAKALATGYNAIINISERNNGSGLDLVCGTAAEFGFEPGKDYFGGIDNSKYICIKGQEARLKHYLNNRGNKR